MHICIYREKELRPSVACTVWAKYERPLIYTVSKNLGDTKPGAPAGCAICFAQSRRVRAVVPSGKPRAEDQSCSATPLSLAASLKAKTPRAGGLLTHGRTELEGFPWRLTLLVYSLFYTYQSYQVQKNEYEKRHEFYF